MKNHPYFQVTRERMVQGTIPDEIRYAEFTTKKDAQAYFYAICDDLCYPWQHIMENNEHYQVIAEAGGVGCDYRITLTYHYV